MAEFVTQDEVIEAVRFSLPAIIEHTRSLPDEEVVGAIMLDGFTVHLINEAEDKTGQFQLSPVQLVHLNSIVAVYHSHPQGQELPSVTDELGHHPMPMVIVTPVSVILWWYSEMTGYYRLWDYHYGVE